MGVTISNCAMQGVQIGDNNIMNINNNQISDREWSELEDFFCQSLTHFGEDTSYHFLSKEALDYTKKKDKKGLVDFIKKYMKEFTNGIFCNLASTSIIEIIKKIGVTLI